MSDRFEPIPRDNGVGNGIAARAGDPAWLLCRQWQFGEFRGEDAGTIVAVHAGVDTHRLDRWQAGGETSWRPYDPTAEPLERLVEEEPADPAADPRLRAEGGIRLGRMLTAAGLAPGPWVRRYRFGEPRRELAARGLSAIIQARAADGARVATGLRRLSDPATADDEATALDLSDSDRAGAGSLATNWLRWWDLRTGSALDGPASHRPPAWNDHRLEYAFAVRASGVTGSDLRAVEYDGGRLDWWSVDATPPVGATAPAAAPVTLSLSGIPAPATFGGMPASRFWEMEDARIDFGSVDAAPHDLGRLLMVAYAMLYSNEWYVVPVRLPVGTLCRVREFTVTDVFGGQEQVTAAGADSTEFHLFRSTDAREPSGASPWFLLAPALPGSLEGPPVESILVARDEMANLAWAIEQRIEDAAGRPTERYDTMVRPERPTPTAMPAYHVDTAVPEFWYPLVPERIPGRESVRLRLLPLVRGAGPDPGAAPGPLPLGVLLAAARDPAGAWLHEEEVPRSGISVARSHQRARWHDGSVHAWTTRRKGSGSGESSSGLRFDTVDPLGAEQ